MRSSLFRPFAFLFLTSMIGTVSLLAQENSELRFHLEREQVQIHLKNWTAPLYFHPSEEEVAMIRRVRQESPTIAGENPSSTLPSNLGDPSAPLVFIAMTPCRLMDTRGFGFTGAFGPPTIAGGTSRTVPVPTSPTCSVPATALAYSVNVTVVPQGPLGYLTIWPTGQPQPVVSTLNSDTGTVVANAAIVPAGTNGSINIYVTSNTDVILDINGYYVPPSTLALGTGTAATPSLIFGTDATSGLYSAGSGSISITTNGTDIVDVNSTGLSSKGNLDFSNVITKSGSTLLQAGNGYGDTALGLGAWVAPTTATNDTAVGAGALAAITSGNNNTATGSRALFANASGYNNTANGYQALQFNTTGASNTAMGYEALLSNNSNGNTAIGAYALQNNTSGGDDNVAIGGNALQDNTTGYYNIAIGSGALQNNTTGSYNVAIGNGAGVAATGSQNILIGNGGAAGESSAIHIGIQSAYSATYIAGIYGVTSASGVPVYVNSAGQLGTATSSRRYKEQIVDLGAESDILMKLRPVAFYYKPELDTTRTRQYGLVAEEVAQVAPELVIFGPNGEAQTVRYHFVNAMLLNEVQKQHRLIEEQSEAIHLLETRLAELERDGK